MRDNSPRYYTPKETCRILRVCERTVYSLVRSGSIPSTKVGGQYRIPSDYVDGRQRKSGN